MPVGQRHHFTNLFDVFVRHALMKQVAHRIHKYHAWICPLQRICQSFWGCAEVESQFVRVSFYTPKSFGEGLGIAMLAPRAEFRAATNGVPS